ncbi:DUF3889 domain-containing protein [Psychrobacillus sp. NPDC096426]|uniref:DUF3889 domain-containing protein n=1 Tax=Psychrobacillus sp. NPDC096426 TaxID=3364491 RepID=UPI003827F95E
MRNTFLALGILLTISSASTHTYAQQEVPAYAPWGKLAIRETKIKYPDANIIDYLHEGSESKEDSTIEKFKLWLKDGDREFGVFVTITYKTKTGELVHIEFKETAR